MEGKSVKPIYSGILDGNISEDEELPDIHPPKRMRMEKLKTENVHIKDVINSSKINGRTVLLKSSNHQHNVKAASSIDSNKYKIINTPGKQVKQISEKGLHSLKVKHSSENGQHSNTFVKDKHNKYISKCTVVSKRNDIAGHVKRSSKVMFNDDKYNKSLTEGKKINSLEKKKQYPVDEHSASKEKKHYNRDNERRNSVSHHHASNVKLKKRMKKYLNQNVISQCDVVNSVESCSKSSSHRNIFDKFYHRSHTEDRLTDKNNHKTSHKRHKHKRSDSKKLKEGNSQSKSHGSRHKKHSSVLSQKCLSSHDQNHIIKKSRKGKHDRHSIAEVKPKASLSIKINIEKCDLYETIKSNNTESKNSIAERKKMSSVDNKEIKNSEVVEKTCTQTDVCDNQLESRCVVDKLSTCDESLDNIQCEEVTSDKVFNNDIISSKEEEHVDNNVISLPYVDNIVNITGDVNDNIESGEAMLLTSNDGYDCIEQTSNDGYDCIEQTSCISEYEILTEPSCDNDNIEVSDSHKDDMELKCLNQDKQEAATSKIDRIGMYHETTDVDENVGFIVTDSNLVSHTIEDTHPFIKNNCDNSESDTCQSISENGQMSIEEKRAKVVKKSCESEELQGNLCLAKGENECEMKLLAETDLKTNNLTAVDDLCTYVIKDVIESEKFQNDNYSDNECCDSESNDITDQHKQNDSCNLETEEHVDLNNKAQGQCICEGNNSDKSLIAPMEENQFRLDNATGVSTSSVNVENISENIGDDTTGSPSENDVRQYVDNMENTKDIQQISQPASQAVMKIVDNDNQIIRGEVGQEKSQEMYCKDNRMDEIDEKYENDVAEDMINSERQQETCECSSETLNQQSDENDTSTILPCSDETPAQETESESNSLLVELLESEDRITRDNEKQMKSTATDGITEEKHNTGRNDITSTKCQNNKEADSSGEIYLDRKYEKENINKEKPTKVVLSDRDSTTMYKPPVQIVTPTIRTTENNTVESNQMNNPPPLVSVRYLDNHNNQDEKPDNITDLKSIESETVYSEHSHVQHGYKDFCELEDGTDDADNRSIHDILSSTDNIIEACAINANILTPYKSVSISNEDRIDYWIESSENVYKKVEASRTMQSENTSDVCDGISHNMEQTANDISQVTDVNILTKENFLSHNEIESVADEVVKGQSNHIDGIKEKDKTHYSEPLQVTEEDSLDEKGSKFNDECAKLLYKLELDYLRFQNIMKVLMKEESKNQHDQGLILLKKKEAEALMENVNEKIKQKTKLSNDKCEHPIKHESGICDKRYDIELKCNRKNETFDSDINMKQSKLQNYVPSDDDDLNKHSNSCYQTVLKENKGDVMHKKVKNELNKDVSLTKQSLYPYILNRKQQNDSSGSQCNKTKQLADKSVFDAENTSRVQSMQENKSIPRQYDTEKGVNGSMVADSTKYRQYTNPYVSNKTKTPGQKELFVRHRTEQAEEKIRDYILEKPLGDSTSKETKYICLANQMVDKDIKSRIHCDDTADKQIKHKETISKYIPKNDETEINSAFTPYITKENEQNELKRKNSTEKYLNNITLSQLPSQQQKRCYPDLLVSNPLLNTEYQTSFNANQMYYTSNKYPATPTITQTFRHKPPLVKLQDIANQITHINNDPRIYETISPVPFASTHEYDKKGKSVHIKTKEVNYHPTVCHAKLQKPMVHDKLYHNNKATESFPPFSKQPYLEPAMNSHYPNLQGHKPKEHRGKAILDERYGNINNHSQDMKRQYEDLVYLQNKRMKVEHVPIQRILNSHYEALSNEKQCLATNHLQRGNIDMVCKSTFQENKECQIKHTPDNLVKTTANTFGLPKETLQRRSEIRPFMSHAAFPAASYHDYPSKSVTTSTHLASTLHNEQRSSNIPNMSYGGVAPKSSVIQENQKRVPIQQFGEHLERNALPGYPLINQEIRMKSARYPPYPVEYYNQMKCLPMAGAQSPFSSMPHFHPKHTANIHSVMSSEQPHTSTLCQHQGKNSMVQHVVGPHRWPQADEYPASKKDMSNDRKHTYNQQIYPSMFSHRPDANYISPAFSPRPEANHKSPMFSPRPEANHKSQMFSPRPEANDKSQMFSPRPEANHKSQMFSPRPEANHKYLMCSPRPETNKNSPVFLPTHQANFKSPMVLPRPEANFKSQVCLPRPEVNLKSPIFSPHNPINSLICPSRPPYNYQTQQQHLSAMRPMLKRPDNTLHLSPAMEHNPFSANAYVKDYHSDRLSKEHARGGHSHAPVLPNQVPKQEKDIGSKLACQACCGTATLLCSGCNKAMYCSTKCQEKMWPKHGVLCSKKSDVQP